MGSKWNGEATMIDLTDEERKESIRQAREIGKLIQRVYGKVANREICRVRRDEKARLKNPVRCRECILRKTCEKRRTLRLRACRSGVRRVGGGG